MNNEEKAIMYGRLLNEHTKLSNAVSEIKGQNLDLSPKQLLEIKQLENKQLYIMSQLQRLMN